MDAQGGPGNAELLTTGQAARLFSVKPDTILKWIKKGKLPALRTPGGHYRVQRRDLEAVLPARIRQGTPGPVECPRPLRCWEYLSVGGEVREECKQCVVFRARAAWCFQVAGLGCGIGHAALFCRGSCEDCTYYRRVRGLATDVLVISADPALRERLAREADESVALRFARNAYEAAAMVCSFRPAFVVVDQEAAAREAGLVESLVADPRLPGVKIILAAPAGQAGRHAAAQGKAVVAVLEKPFGAARIGAVVNWFPVERLAAG